jgi:hypothetical protein
MNYLYEVILDIKSIAEIKSTITFAELWNSVGGA